MRVVKRMFVLVVVVVAGLALRGDELPSPTELLLLNTGEGSP